MNRLHLGSVPRRWRSTRRIAVVCAAVFAVALSACASSPSTAGTTGRSAPPSNPGGGAGTSTSGSGSTVISSTSLPLGDGHVGLTAQVGYIMLCRLTTSGGGGARVDGPWIDTSTGTWNPSEKIHVQGDITWPNAAFSITTSGTTRTITTNDLPKGEPTGTFPIALSDPAHQYDGNPNHITAQSLTYALPINPTVAGQPTCLRGGPIGVTLDGVVLFDALDADDRDGVAHEIQDLCGGHPQSDGMYHYHNITSCLTKNATGSSTLVGYALDGFGIYVEHDANGNVVTDSELDACHGRTSTVMWDGHEVNMYHYDATLEYPYTIGCYKGTPIAAATTPGGGGTGGTGGGGGQPPSGTGGGGGGQPPSGPPPHN